MLNLQGDVVKLIRPNASGTSYTTYAAYTYDAWGNILTQSGTMADINPLRYRGYYYDTETGFYYLQSRYYDPVNHRFINADSYASTDMDSAIASNMFAYCRNNPPLCYDVTGCYGVTIDIGNGWKCRIDPADDSTKTQRHIHVWKDGEKYSQNEDGSHHDSGSNMSGPLPKKVQKNLLKKTGWDYNGNQDTFFEQTIISTDGQYSEYEYADGIVACYIAKSYFDIGGMLESTIRNAYWEKIETKQNASSDNKNTTPIFFTPNLVPAPLPSFNFGFNFFWFPLFA